MKRKTVSTKARVALFQKHGGMCHICGGKINVGEGWELEHIIPFALGGEDEEHNWALAHTKCHKAKTKDDVATIAKAKRREARHIGAKKSKSPMPFGKGSKFKRKMDGTIVER
jgi:5-methylcytosine-specific restriction endonuclease McrA